MTYLRKWNLERFCSEPIENIENYDLMVSDPSSVWCCHHRLEIEPDGTRHSKKELIESNLYFNRPASELIFLRREEHMRLHSTGLTPSEESRHKRATSLINNPAKSKRVRMLGGKEIIFPSMMEAERWLRANGYPKADQAAICRCCCGKVATAYKHRWEYV